MGRNRVRRGLRGPTRYLFGTRPVSAPATRPQGCSGLEGHRPSHGYEVVAVTVEPRPFTAPTSL